MQSTVDSLDTSDTDTFYSVNSSIDLAGQDSSSSPASPRSPLSPSHSLIEKAAAELAVSVPELTQSRDGLLNDKAILDYLKQGSQDEFSSHPVEQANLANEDTKDGESSDDTGMGIVIFSTYSQLSNKSTVGNKSTATPKFLFQAIVPLK